MADSLPTGQGLQARLVQLEVALARRDPTGIVGGLAGLLANDFAEVGASGRAWTRDDARAMLAEEPPRHVEFDDFVVSVIGRDVAILTYRSRDPRPAHRVSIWVRHGQRWLIRFHQGTPIP